MQSVFSKTRFTLKLQENESLKAKQIVHQIWAWYKNKWLCLAILLDEIRLPFISNAVQEWIFLSQDH